MPALLKIHSSRETPARAAPPGSAARVGERPAAEAASLTPVVLVVDDDDAVREALCELLESVGIAAAGFGAARDLLESELLLAPGCLILDVRMPGLGGLALQDHLLARGETKPVIFLSGHGDIPMTVKAMKAGAVDFLTKPVKRDVLLAAVRAALAHDAATRAHRAELRGLRDRFESLTTREREVFERVVDGRLNKQIADELGTSIRTVKAHRANVMSKMAAGSLAELVSLANRLATPARM
jgi:FixJ family two-component response regulator